jgi:hypothetical protein
VTILADDEMEHVERKRAAGVMVTPVNLEDLFVEVTQ